MRSRESTGGAAGGVVPEACVGAGGRAAGLSPNNAPKPRPKAGFAMPARVSDVREVVNLDIGPYREPVSKKSAKIAAIIESFAGRGRDPHYLAYFDCFNRRLFFEAHDVLEEIWLPQKHGPDGAFYKGLIQFAGAFVHLQKGRLSPALALFNLADTNLRPYGTSHHGLSMAQVSRILGHCREILQSSNFTVNPLASAKDSDFQLTLPDDALRDQPAASPPL